MSRTIADRVRAGMEAKGWSAYDLEEASGISQPTIHRILSGQHTDPRINTVFKLAEALGVSEAELRGLVPEKNIEEQLIQAIKKLSPAKQEALLTLLNN